MLISAVALAFLSSAQATTNPSVPLPTRVRPMPAPTVVRPADGTMGADLNRVQRKPDLVVRDMRIGDDATVHILIANEGTAALAGAFDVGVSAYEGSSESGYAHEMFGQSLGIGESKWLKINGFGRRLGPSPPVFRFSEMTAVSVNVDLQQERTDGNGGGRVCTWNAGCVVELNEHNNYFLAKRSEMKPWNGGG